MSRPRVFRLSGTADILGAEIIRNRVSEYNILKLVLR